MDRFELQMNKPESTEAMARLQLIREYMDELEVLEMMRQEYLDSYERYDDLGEEFAEWIKRGKNEFETERPIRIEGYTAKDIHELNKNFSGLGVYNFMILLREQPDKAKEYIEAGFPVL